MNQEAASVAQRPPKLTTRRSLGTFGERIPVSRHRLLQLAVAVALVVTLTTAVLSGSRPQGPEDLPAQAPAVPIRSAIAEPGAILRGERILLIGDSLGLATSPFLKQRLDAVGAHYRGETVGGSGLLNPGIVDWRSRTAQLLLMYRPTTVIAEFCCNYSQPYRRDADGREILPGTIEFRDAWAAEATAIARMITDSGARLYWTVIPPGPPRGAVIEQINATTFDAARRADPPIRLIRWDLALTGGTGEYRDAVEVDGRMVEVRLPDQVHFSDGGADLAARATVDALLADGSGRWGPFDRPEALAVQVRNDFGAGHDPNAAEVDGAALFNGDETVGGLVRRLALGEHWGGPGAPLIRLHATVTGEPPADGWLRSTIAEVRAGVSTGEVAGRLLAGDRAADWTDLDDEAFVERLHERALGRDATPAERGSWSGRVGDPEARALALATVVATDESAGHHAGLVGTALLVTGLLHRVPTTTELGRWATEVASGATDGLALHLLEGDEYAERLPLARGWPVGTGVVGGTTIGPDDAPWLVALVERGSGAETEVRCAGALIDPSWVVTTAACVARRPSAAFDVVVGDPAKPEEVIPVEWIHTDQRFDTTLDGGPALLRLRNPSRREPVTMQLDGRADDRHRSVLGWGRAGGAATPTPRVATVGRNLDEECAGSYGPAFTQATMLCAGLRTGGLDACQGGAPVVTGTGDDRRLVGVVGWGVGCARPGGPAVAVRLSGHRDLLDLDAYIPPFTSARQATDALFEAILNRTPTEAERDQWVSQLEGGSARPDELVTWLSSDAEDDPFPVAVRWWIAVTGEVPSLDVLAVLRVAEQDTDDPRALVDRLLDRPELEATLGSGDHGSFVARLAFTTMGREATPAEIDAASRQLARGVVSRVELALSWAGGEEGRDHLRPATGAVLVTVSLLQRTPTREEFDSWVAAVRESGTATERIRQILRSGEFVDRY